MPFSRVLRCVSRRFVSCWLTCTIAPTNTLKRLVGSCRARKNLHYCPTFNQPLPNRRGMVLVYLSQPFPNLSRIAMPCSMQDVKSGKTALFPAALPPAAVRCIMPYFLGFTRLIRNEYATRKTDNKYPINSAKLRLHG